MAFPVNHKTVFVLDHGPSFAMPSELINLDVRSSSSHDHSHAKVTKTVWSSAVESVLEYVRLVYDIFPPDTDEQKLMRIVVADDKLRTVAINSWQQTEQSSGALSSGLAMVGPPEMTSNLASRACDLRGGLSAALEALCELSPKQQEFCSKVNGHTSLVNRGRLVLLTYVQDEEKLWNLFVELFKSANEAARKADHLAPLVEVELDVVHCSPNNSQTIPFAERVDWADTALGLTFNLIGVSAGLNLAKKMLCLALRHYDLASTTVTGIPMKEEQNSSSSANYDVELFHKASAYTQLFSVNGYSASAPVDLASWMPQTMKEGCEYKTITLKWCTPRGGAATDPQNCISAVRITPTDVNSRPSSCLTNFLLGGRSVMLEMPRRTGTKIVSHMLTSHAGEIFIHTLAISKSVLEDPPSMTEVSGGRVTDYRFNDMSDLIKASRLAPHYGQSKPGVPDPLDQSTKRLTRFAIYCPLTISSTTILNMSVITPLFSIMMKDEISEENEAECRKVIYSLLSMENKGDPLPIPLHLNVGRSKPFKKDEQYKIMFSELERFLEAHCRTDRHRKVLDCLLEVRNRAPLSKPKDPEKVDLDVAMREIDRYSRNDHDEINQRNISNAFQPAQKRLKLNGQNLLELVKGRLERETASDILPFAGMMSQGAKAKLYLSLEKREPKDGTPVPMDL